MEPSTRLWLPPLALAGCVRGVMLRDTRGRALPAEQRDNYFPATPLVSLFWWAEGCSEWLATPGFSQPPAAPVHAPVLFAGPFTLPSHTRNPGEISAFKLLMDQKAFVWAAMANFINGDEKALLFLKRNKLDHYAELAARVQAKIRREGDEGTNFFNSGPFKV